MTEELQRAVNAVRAARAPAGVRTTIVAIDGPGGAGKTSLAACLACVLGASVLHTDDFASWEQPLSRSPELLERALRPLAAGEPAVFRPSSWGGAERELVRLEPGGLVLLEGVASSREAFRPYLAYAIWVETGREARLRRGLERDGRGMRAQWEAWMAEEDRYVADERPHEHADLVLRGDRELWT